jgi:hypothetical protein
VRGAAMLVRGRRTSAEGSAAPQIQKPRSGEGGGKGRMLRRSNLRNIGLPDLVATAKSEMLVCSNHMGRRQVVDIYGARAVLGRSISTAVWVRARAISRNR